MARRKIDDRGVGRGVRFALPRKLPLRNDGDEDVVDEEEENAREIWFAQ